MFYGSDWMTKRNRNRSWLAGLLAGLLLISSAACTLIVPTEPPSPPQMTAGALNATYEAEATETFAATNIPSATVTPSPTATDTPTPCCGLGITELPTLGTGTYVYEVPTPEPISDADLRALAGLCTVEVRGAGDKRDASCVSVVSTVFERMERGELSDGTVRGTIAWGCYAGAKECQFPAYVANGCAGIQPSACPQSYPDSVTHFTIVVYEYLRLRALTDGACQGYFYYGIKPFDRGGCEITAPSGVEGFHD